MQLPDAWQPGVEPLLATGDFPTGDLVFLRYRGSKLFEVGYRHGSNPPRLSPSLVSSPGAIHTIFIAMGSLYPQRRDGWDLAQNQAHPAGVTVAVDGRRVLSDASDPFPATPSAVFFGTNQAGYRGSRPAFTGRIVGVRLVDHSRE